MAEENGKRGLGEDINSEMINQRRIRQERRVRENKKIRGDTKISGEEAVMIQRIS